MKYHPTLDEIDLPEWLPETERIYTDNWLSSFIIKCGIAEACANELGKYLRIYGTSYLSMKHAARESAVWESRETAMSKIDKTAAKLQAQIAALDEPSTELFWQPAQFGPSPCTTRHGETDAFGRTVRRIKRSADTDAVICLRENDIREALTVIRHFARNARRLLPDTSDGPPVNHALDRWVSNMRQIWEEFSGLDFTFSTANDVGVSKAFRFCQAAMAPLDPSVGETEMQTAVRKERTRARRSEVPKPGKNSL